MTMISRVETRDRNRRQLLEDEDPRRLSFMSHRSLPFLWLDSERIGNPSCRHRSIEIDHRLRRVL